MNMYLISTSPRLVVAPPPCPTRTYRTRSSCPATAQRAAHRAPLCSSSRPAQWGSCTFSHTWARKPRPPRSPTDPRLSTTVYPSSSPSTSCSPYNQHGYLAFDAHNAHANRWTPFAGTEDACHSPAPALAASFLRATWAAQAPSKRPGGAEFAQGEKAPDGRGWEDVEWARGRTVLLLGDSIHRFTTKYFCEVRRGARVLAVEEQSPEAKTCHSHPPRWQAKPSSS